MIPTKPSGRPKYAPAARFALVTFLLFAGINLPFVIGRIPRHMYGPPCLVGVTNWLWIATGKHGPYVRYFSFVRFMGEVAIAAGATWGLLKALQLARALHPTHRLN
jgi:hypothetical protein